MIFGGIFYFLFLSDFFQIKSIVVNDGDRISTQEIKSLAESDLEGKILFFRTKTIFLVDTSRIRDNLLKTFPQIEEVKIKKGFPDALNLTIKERKEVGVFCRDIVYFLLDEQGIIFESASVESSLLKLQNQTFTGELELGKKVMEKELLSSILQIESKLRDNLKTPVKEVSIVSDDNLVAKTNDNWEIYFNPKKDLNWQMTELAAVLENRIPEEKRKNLKYIDLRFEKVYIFPETYNQ
jgi:cell division septal protein FtsQ